LTVSVNVCEWVKAPDVPVIVKVYVARFVCGFADPEHPARTTNKIIAVTIANRVRSRCVLDSRNSSSSARASGTTCRHDTGGVGILVGGTISAVVVTVTVDVCGGVIEAGTSVHVESVSVDGSAQVSNTAELNPPLGATATV
jgi:hypothetical protein